MKLEEKITILRKKQGWSQEELAFRLDVSRQAVSKWEMGASVPDLDKIIKMSEIFNVTTDYLLKDTLEREQDISENNINCETDKTEGETAKPPRQVCDEEGNGYISVARKNALKIAVGVALCILSPICLIVLNGLAMDAKVSENIASGVGITVLLLMCAIGVIFLIAGGMALSKYEYLEEETIEISNTLKHRLLADSVKENKSFIAAIATGVALCILSAVPVILFGILKKSEGAGCYGVGILLALVAIGVFLFVKAGIIHSSYAKLLQEEEYSVEKKNNKESEESKYPVLESFSDIYWTSVLAIYLLWSFISGNWGLTWIIWPIASVVHIVGEIIIKAIYKKKRGHAMSSAKSIKDDNE